MKIHNSTLVSSLFSFFTLIGLIIMSCTDNQHNNKNNTDQTVEVFDLEVTRTLIQKRTNEFTEAHITKDTAFLNSCFASDARVFPPNSQMVKGYKAISELNADWVNYGIKEFREESTFFYGNETYVVDEGNYFLRYGEEDILDKGKYINIWKLIDGEWKLYSNIWNTNLPQ